MAQKLVKSDLSKLLSWLEQYLPQSFKLYAVLKSHLKGRFPDLEFFVDKWPDPQAAACIVDRAGEQLQSRDFFKYIVLGLFGLTDEGVTTLLRDSRLVDWSVPFVFCAVPDRLWPGLEALLDEKGKSLQLSNPCYLLEVVPEDLKLIPVPEGMKFLPVSEEHISMVDTTWKFSSEGSDIYMRELAQHNPSLILFTEAGQHVGHMLGKSDNTMGMLFIQPEFRRKGYAKVIVSQLVQKFFDQGEQAVHVIIEEDNPHSVTLHQSVGFKVVPDLKVAWLRGLMGVIGGEMFWQCTLGGLSLGLAL